MNPARKNTLAVLCMLVVAYLSVFGIWRADDETTRHHIAHGGTVGGLEPREAKDEKEWKAAKSERTGGVLQLGSVPFLDPPFGYNKKRNVERWKMIYTSMLDDTNIVSDDFSLVDYGADEGYFSISAAQAFPKAKVMAVDMGGKGGSIWKKDHDVLKVQEQKIKQYRVGERVIMCQTAVTPEHFFKLSDASTGHDYQYVLSVFHWFTMETRADFEKVLVKLFKNARTTFIELPIAGDFGPRFMKQVGSKHFVKWYDGRSNIEQIIIDSLTAHDVSHKVTMIGSVKWFPGDKAKGEKDWNRDVFRVDLTDSPHPFECQKHFDIYGCAPTTNPEPVEFSKCS